MGNTVLPVQPAVTGDKPLVIFLMGPTASGKTDLAIRLCQHLPVDVISVDSALVYRGMDIGTAKPSLAEQARAPHQLIDICEPAEHYSAADFCRDALAAILRSIQTGRIPLLVGGTMMYFKALLEGLAPMPASTPEVRALINQQANELGWPAMHQMLMDIDPIYASTLHPNHSQRIGRALEVYRLSGKTMSDFRDLQSQHPAHGLSERCNIVQIGLLLSDRARLHQRIETRFMQMLASGFVDEVKTLRMQTNLHLDLPAIRAVGYRQIWQHLDGEFDYNEMVARGLASTRQLAKRQMTWLRGWENINHIIMDRSVNAEVNKLQQLTEIVHQALNLLPIKAI